MTCAGMQSVRRRRGSGELGQTRALYPGDGRHSASGAAPEALAAQAQLRRQVPNRFCASCGIVRHILSASCMLMC